MADRPLSDEQVSVVRAMSAVGRLTDELLAANDAFENANYAVNHAVARRDEALDRLKQAKRRLDDAMKASRGYLCGLEGDE